MLRAARRARRGRRVDLGDLARLTPIDRGWGFQRGKPIDRAYIESFLNANRAAIRGRVLEVGGSAYTRRFGSGVERSDVLDLSPNPRATFIANLEDAPVLPDGAFDCVLLTQVLQYIPDVRAALRTVERVLAPDGVLLVTVPGITRISGSEDAIFGDWWRFTSRSLELLLRETIDRASISISAQGNVLTATALLYGLACEDLTPAALTTHDPLYEVIISARVMKPSE